MSVTKLTSNIGDIINAERALVRSDEEAKIVTDFLERQSKAAIEARKVNEIEEKRIRVCFFNIAQIGRIKISWQ